MFVFGAKSVLLLHMETKQNIKKDEIDTFVQFSMN